MDAAVDRLNFSSGGGDREKTVSPTWESCGPSERGCGSALAGWTCLESRPAFVWSSWRVSDRFALTKMPFGCILSVKDTPIYLIRSPVFLYRLLVSYIHDPMGEMSVLDKEQLGTVGMVARWQPVHNGHVPVLHALCDRADRAFIGIGSANRHTVRNPFSLEETEDMIRLVLAERENYVLLPVADLDDGPRWRTMVVEMFGPLDQFVTANPYVWSLLEGEYPLIRPVDLVPDNARVAIDGTMVRRAMARGDDWHDLVPGKVAEYITRKQLDERFRREFGLEALAMEAIVQ